MTDEEKSFQQALYEILSTELDYCKNVEIIIEVFMIPMTSKGLLADEKAKDHLFGNLMKLIPLANHVRHRPPLLYCFFFFFKTMVSFLPRRNSA